MSAVELRAAFTPNRVVSRSTVAALVGVQVAVLAVLWVKSPFDAVPGPLAVLSALRALWFEQGLGPALAVSVSTSLEALALATGLSLALAYASVVPALRPVAGAVSRGRFLGLSGLTFVFMLTVGGGQPLRLALLVFGLTVFLTTSLVAEVAAIPPARFDHARTLRMSGWRVVWEVVVLGTADRALELVRQNAAIGWTLLTTVEGLTRAEGGVGTLLLDQNKHLHLAEVFALQAVILAVGLGQDAALGWLRRVLCPWVVAEPKGVVRS
jgi:NitT/TauT family transport system permease protein